MLFCKFELFLFLKHKMDVWPYHSCYIIFLKKIVHIYLKISQDNMTRVDLSSSLLTTSKLYYRVRKKDYKINRVKPTKYIILL